MSDVVAHTLAAKANSSPEPLAPLRALPGALPVVAIAGTRGKSTCAWMLDAIVRGAGYSMGAWLSSGVHINGLQQLGELGPWTDVVRRTLTGDLDLSVQEMDASTVVAAGLPAGVYPLAIMTTLCGNNELCLSTPQTRVELRALERVAAAVHDNGVIIANADDMSVAELSRRRGVRCVLFALNRENPVLQQHLNAGHHAGWVADGEICIGTRMEHAALVQVADIPATLDGTMIFQVQNALAAATAAVELGIAAPEIRDALRAFSPDPVRQPAACNIIPFGGATIVVDAPSQVWSLRMLARSIRHQPRRRTIVVSGTFPRLRDEDVVDAGRVVGGLGGMILVHGEHATDDRLHAFKSGVAAAGTPPVVVAMLDELRAIDHALNIIGPGDIALVLADDPTRALDHLWPAPSISISSRRLTQERNGR